MPNRFTRRGRTASAADPAPETRAIEASFAEMQTPLGTHWSSPLSRDRVELVDTGADRYHLNPIAARCIDLMADAIGERDLAVLDADKAPIATHWVMDLWNKGPNAYQSARAFRRTVAERLVSTGQAHILLGGRRGPEDAQPTSLTLLTGKIEIVLSDPTPEAPHGEITDWLVTAKSADGTREKVWRYAPGEILWLRFPSAEHPWRVKSPLTAALTDLGLAEAARTWQAAEFKGGSAKAIVALEGAPDEKVAQIRADVQAIAEGSENAGRIALVGTPNGRGVTVHQMGQTAENLGYSGTVEMTGKMIAQALGIPEDLVFGNATFANAETAIRNFWQQNIIPKLRLIASEIDRVLIPEDNLTAHFPVDDIAALQADEDAEVGRLKMQAEADILTIDEARAERGYDPLPDGAGAVTRTVYIAQAQASLRPESADLGARFAPAPPQPASHEGACETHSPQVRDTAAGSSSTQSTIEKRAVGGGKKAQREIETQTRIHTKAVQRFADSQEARVINNLKRQAKRVTFRIDEENPLAGIWNTAAEDEAATAVAAQAAEASFYAGLTALAADIGWDASAAFVPGDISKAAEEAIQRRAAATADLFNGTTKSALRETLLEGSKAGEGVPALTARVKAVYTTMKTSRAEVIARDVVVGGLHEGQRAAVENSGLTGVRRRWLAAGDGRVRASHLALSGYTTEGMNDRYPNGALFPGDHAAGPGEALNCRCVEEFLTDEDE